MEELTAVPVEVALSSKVLVMGSEGGNFALPLELIWLAHLVSTENVLQGSIEWEPTILPTVQVAVLS